MKYLSRKNVLQHHDVGPDASSNADNRLVPICSLGAFSGTGVNKDPPPNIDRVYVSCLHILSRHLKPLKTESRGKKIMVQKKNVNVDQKKRRRKKSTMLTEETLERHMKALQALPSSKASHRKDLFQGFA